MKERLYLSLFLWLLPVYIFGQPNKNCWIFNLPAASIPNSYINTTPLVKMQDGFLAGGAYFRQEWPSTNGSGFSLPDHRGIFLAKYDYDGNLIWINYTKTHYTATYDEGHISSITTDSSGNIYICGADAGRRFFYNNGNDSVHLGRADTAANAWVYPSFVAKLDKNGKVIWNNCMNSGPLNIMFSNNKLIMQGYYGFYENYYCVDTARIQTHYMPFNYQTIHNYLYWIDTNGTLTGRTKYIRDGVNIDATSFLTTDKEGSIYIGSDFEYGVDLYHKDSTSFMQIPFKQLLPRFFIAKYDSSGIARWWLYDRRGITDNFGSILQQMKTDNNGNTYAAIYQQEEYYPRPDMFMYFSNAIPKVVPRKFYRLHRIDKNGNLNWYVYGGIELTHAMAVNDTSVVIIGSNGIDAQQSFRTQRDTFYSTDPSQKIWFPHTGGGNIAIVKYDSAGKIMSTMRKGSILETFPHSFAGLNMSDAIFGNNNSLILYGTVRGDSIEAFGDTLSSTGVTDRLLLKFDADSCSNANSPQATPTVYFNNENENVFCLGDSVALYTTTSGSFGNPNKFYLERFDYTYANNKVVHDTIYGSTMDSFKFFLFPTVAPGIYVFRISASYPSYWSSVFRAEITNAAIPSVQIAMSPDTIVNRNTQATFTASSQYGGKNAVYKWYVNNIEVPMVNGPQYITDSLNYNDNVHAVLISSLSCAVPASATSNKINVIFTGVNDMTNSNILIYPNPNNGDFIIESVNGSSLSSYAIYDMIGIKVASSLITGKVSHVQLPEFTPGYYILQLMTEQGPVTKKLLIQ